MRPSLLARTSLDAVAGAATVAMVGLGAIGMRATGLRIQMETAAPVLLGCLALGALLIAYRKRDPKLRAMLRFSLWGVALSNAYLLPMYALSRLGRPLADGWLQAADAAIGLDIGHLARWTRAQPQLMSAAVWVYDSLQPFCLVAVVGSTLSGHTRRAERAVLALVVASALTLLVHGLWPAIGPWVHDSTWADEGQRATSAAYASLRSGRPYEIDLSRPDALVAFPSWHVILAVLCAASLPASRQIASLAWLWAGAIALSTLLTGWHYAMDVLGALVTAALALRLAAALAGRLSVQPR